jgi:hypothetical protein
MVYVYVYVLVGVCIWHPRLRLCIHSNSLLKSNPIQSNPSQSNPFLFFSSKSLSIALSPSPSPPLPLSPPSSTLVFLLPLVIPRLWVHTALQRIAFRRTSGTWRRLGGRASSAGRSAWTSGPTRWTGSVGRMGRCILVSWSPGRCLLVSLFPGFRLLFGVWFGLGGQIGQEGATLEQYGLLLDEDGHSRGRVFALLNATCQTGYVITAPISAEEFYASEGGRQLCELLFSHLVYFIDHLASVFLVGLQRPLQGHGLVVRCDT